MKPCGMDKNDSQPATLPRISKLIIMSKPMQWSEIP